MKLIFIGADHEVTGSCHYLQVGEKHILVDYGMQQGIDAFENAELPVCEAKMDYVLLTQAMNDYLNPKGKPHVILEGHSDIAMERQEPSLARKTSPRVCMYAGGVSKQYGLENLVKGFRKADLPDARLEIYGPGDYVQELSQIAAEDSRIFYGGMLLNAEIVEREMAATLLVNPRPTGEEYVKYSFPSKTMEYMSTGTPVLTTVLPGMPKEYHPYVCLLEEETADAIAEKLGQIFAQPADALFEKGMKAREFILKEKNNVTQAGKILAMLERDGVQ